MLSTPLFWGLSLDHICPIVDDVEHELLFYNILCNSYNFRSTGRYLHQVRTEWMKLNNLFKDTYVNYDTVFYNAEYILNK